MQSFLVLILVALPVFWTSALAEGCSDYPYTRGISIEDVDGGTKIVATASVGVSFDDVDAVNDAIDEATLTAKSLIAQFLQESISRDEAVDRTVRETKSMQGAGKEAKRTEVIQRVKQLRDSSSALLRGVLPLGDCYTNGKEVRVSVGLKPETIASASGVSGSVGRSVAVQPTPGSQARENSTAMQAPSATNRGVTPLNSVPSFSNSQSLRRF